MAANDLLIRMRVAGAADAAGELEQVNSSVDGMGRRAKIAAAATAAAVAGIVGSTIKSGFSYNASFQDAHTSFKTLLGDADEAKTFAEDLRGVSEGSALRLTEVFDPAKRMIGMGMEADQTVDTLRSLNLAVMATGGNAEQFDRASLALAQMSAKGKVSAEEMMQLAEAGLPIQKILGKELNLTGEQIANIGKENISADKVIKAVTKSWGTQYKDAAEEASGNWSIQTAMMRKDWEKFQRVVTAPLFNKLNETVLPVLAGKLSEITKQFGDAADGTSTWGEFYGVLDNLAGAGGRLEPVIRNIVGIARDLGSILTDAVIPAVADMGVIAGGTTAVGIAVLSKVVNVISENADIAQVAIKLLVARLVLLRTWAIAVAVKSAVLSAAMTVWAIKTRAVTIATTAFAVAQGALNLVMRANPLMLVITGLMLLAGAFILLWKKSESFRNVIKGVWDTVKKAFTDAYNWIKRQVQLLKLAWEGLKIKARDLADDIKGKFNSVVDFFKKMPGRIGNAVKGLFNGIRDQFKAAINWIIDKWNSFELSIGPIKIPAAPDIPKISVSTPNIPRLYTGGEIERGGWAQVGELGPELVRLPGGSTVYDAEQTAAAKAGAGGGTVRLELVGGTAETRAAVRTMWDLFVAHGEYRAAHG